MKPEFDQLLADLKKSRDDIDRSLVDGDESQSRTSDLLQKINDLRQRSVKTDRAFEDMTTARPK